MPIDNQQSLEMLASSLPVLREELSRIRDSWSPEEPPFTVVMGALGRTLATASDTVDDAAVDNVAAVIEELLNTGIQSILDGVCTGLLESLMHVADGTPSAERILGRLGPAATAYCNAWDKFTGKED